MLLNETSLQVPELESFRLPEGVEKVSADGIAASADVTSIVSTASYTFDFRENSNTPGRWLEKSVVVNVPSGTGFFTSIPYLMGAFTTSNFQNLTERPLGQFSVAIGLRGNNLVCSVRLTDSNSDDPIFIRVIGIIVFYR
ncbi:hypothetical protein H6G74_27355 [Nostoc spongiaeforme FACHB-130]|uniref:Uncharacterized protein n=1 Tax=Nostoc spongiaeforme FACHB-130 TaxID=1357510 RepID=A0ABR8G460_9NOSO|nr:hypothetical protein [Nostoc spongiaeforme]MBD2598013.1 hypothetical protein [Nostoc spongiaeforme FACHB-130]